MGNEMDRVSQLGGLRVTSRGGRRDVVCLHGELDLATRDVLAAALDVRSETRDLRVDAAGLSFVDCSGLGTLVEIAQTVRSHGHRFEITRASRALARLSELTGQSEMLGLGRPGRLERIGGERFTRRRRRTGG
jgi:anti-anti-sigma factor